MGNNLLQQSCYNPNTLRLTDLRTYPGAIQSCAVTNPANARLNLSYLYQNNGNIYQATDRTRNETLTYTYDELDRLDIVSGPYSLDYNYNTIGNITSKSGTTYSYGSTAHKHAVTAVGTNTYGYDANGNMTTRTEGGSAYTQAFDTENQLTSVTVGGQVTQFIYDPDGNLVKKIKPDGSKTLYIGGVYEVDKASGGTVIQTRTYYPAAGAMRIGGTLYYMLKDHLGSASVLTDANGNAVPSADTRYYPFGEARFSTTPMLTDKLFTGQREITGLGIYYYGARFYSPYINRFLSADTVVPGYTNPQSLNRYSYGLNNPSRYTDPTGHRPCEEFAGYCFPEDTPADTSGGGGGGTTGGNAGNHDDNTSDEQTPDSSVVIKDPLDPVLNPGGLPIVIPIAPLPLPDLKINPAIWTPRSPRDWNSLAGRLGIDPDRLKGNVHRCKQTSGVPPNGNVQIDDETGDIYYQGEYIGNARDGC